MPELSRTQIDKLGQRLVGTPDEDDLRLLTRYRESFEGPFQQAAQSVREVAATLPGSAFSARPAKSTLSIVRKLRRESIRLTQMQDIAGCRLVVSTIQEQDTAVSALLGRHPAWRVHDRRKRPNHGYRAVHLVCKTDGYPIEIQVRTTAQHGWAEYSEMLDRAFLGDVKYGGGPSDVRSSLDRLSELLARIEEGRPLGSEVSLADLLTILAMLFFAYAAQRRGGKE